MGKVNTQDLKKVRMGAMAKLLYLRQQVNRAQREGRNSAPWQEQVDKIRVLIQEMDATLDLQTQVTRKGTPVVQAQPRQTLDCNPSYQLLSIQRKAIQELLRFNKKKLEEFDLILRNKENLSKLEDLGCGSYYHSQVSLELQDYNNCLYEIRKLERILAHSTIIQSDDHTSIQLGTWFSTFKNQKQNHSPLENIRQYLLLDEIDLPNLTPKEGVDILTADSLMGHMALGLKVGEELNGEIILKMQNAESMKYPVLQMKRGR